MRKLALVTWILAAGLAGLWWAQRLARAQQCSGGTCVADCNSVEIAPVGLMTGHTCKYKAVSPDGTSACDCGPKGAQPKDGWCRYETCKCNSVTSSPSQCESQGACQQPGPNLCSNYCN